MFPKTRATATLHLLRKLYTNLTAIRAYGTLVIVKSTVGKYFGDIQILLPFLKNEHMTLKDRSYSYLPLIEFDRCSSSKALFACREWPFPSFSRETNIPRLGVSSNQLQPQKEDGFATNKENWVESPSWNE